MLSIIKLIKLLLVIPATNATLEPSLSVAKRIKMFLTAWNRLHHCIILQDIHCEKADEPNMIEMANDSIGGQR